LLLNRRGHVLIQGKSKLQGINSALNKIIGLIGAEPAHEDHHTAADVQALRAAVLQLGEDVFPPAYRIRIPFKNAKEKQDYLDRLAVGVRAVQRNWRKKLERARTNFKPDSYVDVA
jgi:hypothetical protein